MPSFNSQLKKSSPAPSYTPQPSSAQQHGITGKIKGVIGKIKKPVFNLLETAADTLEEKRKDILGDKVFFMDRPATAFCMGRIAPFSELEAHAQRIFQTLDRELPLWCEHLQMLLGSGESPVGVFEHFVVMFGAGAGNVKAFFKISDIEGIVFSNGCAEIAASAGGERSRWKVECTEEEARALAQMQKSRRNAARMFSGEDDAV